VQSDSGELNYIRSQKEAVKISMYAFAESLMGGQEHKNQESSAFPLRRAGMDCRPPGSRDASGDIHVSLDSSAPCWNDRIERDCLH